MTVEIICVGTEILLGNIVNTNAAYLAGECAKLGLTCYYQTVVGDNEQRLLKQFEEAKWRSDIILVSGGLGPTEDDLTKETLAKFLKKDLLMDEESRQHIEAYFAERKIKLTNNNWKQAMLPEGAKALKNPNGTAPGVFMETENNKYFLLPGPPGELIPMFESQVAPILKSFSQEVICSQTVKLCGIGESEAETMIADLIDAQTNPTIATYAKIGEVHIRVTAKAEDKKEAGKLLKPVVKELKNRFGNAIYTTQENTTLEMALVDLLVANKMSISCAESCTGGKLAARLVEVAGVSQVFKAGFVTYSNKSKRKVLGVKKSTLQKEGAVSKQVAYEMVKGLAGLTGTDVAVSVTGLAGPDGGTQDRPVGTVYMACDVKGKITEREFFFKGNREKIRESAVAAALRLVRECVLEDFSIKTFGKE